MYNSGAGYMIGLFKKNKAKEEPNGFAMLDTISRLNRESIENLEFVSKSLDLLLSLSITYINYPEYTVPELETERSKTPKEDYYNMKQIAQMTGIGINTLTKYCNHLMREGKIRYVTDGKNSGKLYYKDDVNTIISYYRQKNPRKVTKIAKLS